METDDLAALARALEWWEWDCPLKKFRRKHNLSQVALCRMTDLNIHSLRLWERGVTMPSDEGIDKLTRLMGPDTTLRWAEWLAAKPSAFDA